MHNGIELRIEIDGKPIVISNSVMLYSLLKFSNGNAPRDLLDAVNTTDAQISVIVRAVDLPADEEIDTDCETAEPSPGVYAVQRFQPEALAVLREEIRGVFADLAEDQDERPTRSNAAHWWDRAELVNWQYRDSGSTKYGLMLVHLPCGHPEYRIESLTESVSRAAQHRCKRDERPADSPAIVEFIADRSRRG